jgi:hypothetical protein
MAVIKTFAVLLVGLLVTVNAISERCGAKCEKSYSEETQQVRCQNELYTEIQFLSYSVIPNCITR